MADCSRPPAHNQHKKNLSSVFGFRSKGTYDNVFESRPKMRVPAFTPGVTDYVEIFNCNRPSSIPVLDLDVFEKREEVVDYGNVFGGMSDAAIGSSYEEVFRSDVGGGGVRGSTFDSYSHSRGSCQSKAAEESQKLPHESLLEKKHSLPSEKYVGKKGNTDETNSFEKTSDAPVPARAFDGTVPPKKANVGITAVKFQQESDEVPVGKHSRKVSSSGISRHGDGFIDVDMRSRHGNGSDKSVSSEPLTNENIRPNVQMSEEINGTDSNLHLGGSMATSNSALKFNTHEEDHEGSNRSSNGVSNVQNMHGSNPIINDSTNDETAVKRNAIRSKDLSSDYDHGPALANTGTVTGNSSARNSNGSENGKKERLQESSDFTPAMHSQLSFSKTNTLSEDNIIPEIAGSSNVDSQSIEKDSNGYLANNFNYEYEIEGKNSSLKKPSTTKSDVFQRSAYSSVIEDNSSSSSDDEIDKNSEAFVSAAAVKKALREAQALINIAKKSNGVKGFMNLSMAKHYGKSKLVKEEHNPKVKENPKFFEPGPTEIKNNFSTSASRRDYPAPWSGNSARNMAPVKMVVEEVSQQRSAFNVDQMKAVELEMQSSLEQKTQDSATKPLMLPSVNSFQENLATLHNTITDSGQVRLVPEAYCSPVSTFETREKELNPYIHEAFLVKNHESCTVTSITGAEGESQTASSNSDQDFVMHKFPDEFVKTEAGCLANGFEIKQDVEVVYDHNDANQNEAIEVESEGHVSSNLTSLEEENVKETELDAQDQVLDYDDTDSQDYASAEENWESTDTDDEITNNDHRFSAQNNVDGIEEMQNVVSSKLISDVLASRLNNIDVDQMVGQASLQTILTKEAQVSDEETTMIYDQSDLNPVVEEIVKIEGMRVQNMVTREADITSEATSEPIFNSASEELILEEADKSENVVLQNMSIHEVDLVSKERTVPVSIYSNEDPIVEKTDESEDAPVLFTVTSKVNTLEDCSSSLINIANEDPRDVETEGLETVTGQTIVTPETIIAFVNNTASCFAYSDEDQVVGDDAEHATIESRVRWHDNNLEKEIMGAAKLHEQTTLYIEDSVARLEIERASCADHESSFPVDSGVELIRKDGPLVTSGADEIEESTSTPFTYESEKQEMHSTSFCDLDHRTDSEESKNEIHVEADATEDGHETLNVKGFENNKVDVDAADKEDVIDTEPSSWNSEHVNYELEAEVQFSEPVPDSNEHTEPREFMQPSDNFVQPAERHGRRKWDISRETFELPELEMGALDIQDTTSQECVEMERQMDKPERKKWEIPNEAFELPVLDDEIVESVGSVLDDEIIEENVENLETEKERATQSSEKPERKKWKIHKEVLEVPIICAEVVEDTSDHEGLVLKTPSEEMSIMDNFTLPAEIVPLNEVQNDFSASGKVVSDEGTSCKPFGENTEVKNDFSACGGVVSDKCVPCEMFGENTEDDIGKHREEIKVGEGKAVGQDEPTKGSEEINVKDEIKRTLGMFWKKILKVNQSEDPIVELAEKQNATSSNQIGGETHLNLNGPVELVESPRQNDDSEAVSFSKTEENREAAPYSEAFDVNHKINEFVSVETEGQRSSPLSFDSSKYQEGEKQSSFEEACNENNVGDHVESQIEGALSSSGSEDGTEMAPTRSTCDSYKEGTPECNIQPPNVNENGQIESETFSELQHLQPDESLADYKESTRKSTNVLKQNGLKNEDDGISDENMSEVELETLVDDLSDKRGTDSEQRDTNSSRQDTDSASDNEVPEVTPSHEFEQKADKNGTFPDRIEQSQTWKWIFGEDLKDKSNEQDRKTERKVKANTPKTNDDVHTSNVTINGDEPTSMEDTPPMSMHKEPDQDVFKKSIRTKELERVAVERAIREARERAFNEARERAATNIANAEARERAAKEKTKLESRERIASERAIAEARERAAIERANADARQKVNSTGQERFHRTSSESNLTSEKNSLEAKRKAELERAAVERATTEARQRALEKAMSRKEQATQSSSSRSTNASSDHYGSSTNSKHNDDTSESALRFKARNERHQRIAERAAKALAEKNMRDLLVQREQAERNRLAEVLDADVKRWARGKTGNLRALLSTLQYILGPDSGWQAIHLTEIVTADAVKKAYRKATLFVHPDKLQQRGATIRQKYICEKVFDLLKEAWTKFDRDER